MFKNKDGSYNKFSILILSLIVIIGLFIISNSIQPSEFNIDNNISIILGIITGLIILLIIFFIKKKLQLKSQYKPEPKFDSIVEPSKLKHESEFNSIIESTKLNSSINSLSTYTPLPTPAVKESIDKLMKYEKFKEKEPESQPSMVSIIITLILIPVTFILGATIINSLINAMPVLPENAPPELIQTQQTVTNTFSIFINLMPILIGVILITFVASMIFGTRRDF